MASSPRLARFLILALVAGLIPAPAAASVSGSPGAIASEVLPELAVVSLPPGEVPLGVVVVVSWGPLSLTKTAFGELVAHTGSDPQPYAFTGEPLDLNVGWQYHRARWMDPRVGRFPAQDPLIGTPLDPPTLHRYLYANSDPVNRVDPSGLTANVATAATTTSITFTLASSQTAALTVSLAAACTTAQVIAASGGSTLPCRADRRDRDSIEEFVHGTTREAAQSILTTGVQPVSAEGFAFFTVSTREPLARQVASAFAINRAGTSLDAALVVMTLPSRVFNELRSVGFVLPPRPLFLGGVNETVFLPPSFPALNSSGVFRIEPVQP